MPCLHFALYHLLQCVIHTDKSDVKQYKKYNHACACHTVQCNLKTAFHNFQITLLTMSVQGINMITIILLLYALVTLPKNH